MTRARRTTRIFRHVLLVLGVLYVLAAVAWVVTPFIFPSTGAASDRWPNATFVGLILLGQWVFLRPSRLWTIQLTRRTRPLRAAVFTAAAMAAILTFGAVALLLEIPDWWEPINEKFDSGVGLSFFALWGIWACIFFVYWRQGDRYTQLGKMVRALVAGSLLEAFVAVPAHIVIMRHRDCYCARGSFFSLVCCGTVLLWAFGPGIVLLYAREKYRCARLLPMCKVCGYDLRGSTSRCPECGTPFDSDASQTPTE